MGRVFLASFYSEFGEPHHPHLSFLFLPIPLPVLPSSPRPPLPPGWGRGHRALGLHFLSSSRRRSRAGLRGECLFSSPYGPRSDLAACPDCFSVSWGKSFSLFEITGSLERPGGATPASCCPAEMLSKLLGMYWDKGKEALTAQKM